MKKGKNYRALPAIILAALYLTFLVGRHTLETAMQRVFIFGYFVVMGVLACALKSKYAEGKPFPAKSRIAAAALAALLVGAGWNTFLPGVRFPAEDSYGYALWEKILYTLGAWITVSYFAQLALLFLARPIEKRGWTERQKVFAFLLMGNFVFLFFTSDKIQPTHLTQGFLLLLTVASVWCFNRKSGCMEKYRTKGSRAVIVLIAVYASLASFAQRFFLDGNTRMHFSLPGLFYVLSDILWFIPVIWLLLFALEWFAARPRTLPKPEKRRRAGWILFAWLAVCQIVVLWILWPGGFPVDAIDQLSQATWGYINDWHPAMHTLLEKLILTVIPNAGAITAVQMLLFTWLLTAILMIGYDSGIPLRLLAVLGAFVEFLPNQALSGSNVLKDFPFTLALLWGLYLLALLAMKKPWSKSLGYYACLAIDIFLICTLRHNGIVPGLAIAVLCIVLTVKRYAAVQWKALAAVLAAAALFAVYKGPVFTALGIGTNGMSPYTTMLCAVGSCINKDLPLSEESEQIMEKALPLDDWGAYYSRYAGHDPYYWGRPEGSVPYTPSEITAGDAFTVYLEALRKYPDVVIKDRLDGMDILWDIVQPPDSFNAKTFSFISPFDESSLPLRTDGLERQEDGSYVKTTWLARAYYATTYYFSLNSAVDILLWRTGAYLIAFWVLLLFWSKNRMGRLWWAAVPMLGNVAASMLVLYHQSFRYVYFVQVSVMALLFLSIALKQVWDGAQPPEPAKVLSDAVPEKEDDRG